MAAKESDSNSMDDSKPAGPNRQWKKTCDQLKQAFDAWDTLNHQELGPSADEKRLMEMKDLLRDLKGKLEALEAPTFEEPPAQTKPEAATAPLETKEESVEEASVSLETESLKPAPIEEEALPAVETTAEASPVEACPEEPAPQAPVAREPEAQP